MSRAFKRSFFTTIAIFCVISCSVIGTPKPQTAPSTTPQPKPEIADAVIDHSGHVDPDGPIYKGANEDVVVRIVNTDPRCFIYKGWTVPTPSEAAARVTEVTLRANTGSPGPPAILRITAVKNPRAPQDCDFAAMPERKVGGDPGPWEIRILRAGWDLAFSGAYTADSLTNPVYGLVPGSVPTDTTSTQTTTGYYIQRFADQEDTLRLGAAAMIHAVRSGPHSFSRWDTGFAPTFGIGVESNTLRYFLGPGLRFGDKFYLSAGVAIGSVTRLPAGLSASKPTDNPRDRTSFTTNANALSNPPTTTRVGYFFGVSFSFAGVGPDTFKGTFRELDAKPATEAKRTGTATTTATSAPSSETTATSGTTGTTRT